MEDLLILINGTVHPKRVRVFELQKKIIEIMKQEKILERAKLAEGLTLNLSQSKDNRRFYRALSPLLNKLIVSERKGGYTLYHYDPLFFKYWLEKIRREARQWLGEM